MFLGIDIGGTKLLAIARNPEGRSVGRWRVPTGATYSPASCIEAIRAVAAEVTGPEAVGVGFPGLVDPHAGRVRSSVILTEWSDFPLCSVLEDALGVPCRLDNDVNNAARAECLTRSRYSVRNPDFLFVSVGTGIGGAVVLNGKIWQGLSGLAGEIGHFGKGLDVLCNCGRMGCIGAAAGGRALEEGATGADMSSSALSSGPLLGSAIADAMNLLNLPLVVLGGGVTSIGERYRRRVEAGFRSQAMQEVADDCRIELAAAGYDAGAVGSALLAAEAASAYAATGPGVRGQSGLPGG